MPTMDPEASLLLANIDSALRELEASRREPGATDTVPVLERALSTYGSIKHLVPKLNLGREQQSLVEERLLLLRECIVVS